MTLATAQLLTNSRLRLVFLALIVLLLLCTLLSNSQRLSRPLSYFRPSQHSVQTTSVLKIDWSRYAYVQYATALDHVCNSLMIFASLNATSSLADRVLLYPRQWSANTSVSDDPTTRLLAAARDEYRVRLEPIDLVRKTNSDEDTWAEGYTKLLAWNQTQYERVLQVDSDAVVLQSMDELFLLPSAPLAIPRAYWLPADERKRSAQLMLITPSATEFARVEHAMKTAGSNDYDMEIVNTVYKDSCLVLPHRPYNLLTGEFKSAPDKHAAYLGNDKEAWDGEKVLREAKYLHFSDWPIPKPWMPIPEQLMQKHQPACWEQKGSPEKDCRDRIIWRGFYEDFRKRRKDLCGLGVDGA